MFIDSSFAWEVSVLSFSASIAFSLNFLTEAAQVPVSTLGKIFNTNLLPAKSDKEVVLKSVFTNLKSGDFDPPG